ncbi:IclR family transcriptional regulator [Mycolicibacterium palauense]|uniref:IclR family transcriptional regulator n=1 Tax=Mycolicibacterium palauense TaxID=2034511 RepID=UPI00159B84F2|nr:IclR family transcriptional regulator [Mycolicibacterium palauense]
MKFLAAHGEPVRAATLSRELGLPRSSTYQLIAVMQDEGFIVHFPEDQTYALSASLGELAAGSASLTRLERMVNPLLATLAKRTGLPVVAHASVLTGSDVVYAATHRAPRAPKPVNQIGVRLPAHLTASGRALLAYVSEPQLRATYPDDAMVLRRAGYGPSSLRELRSMLREIRDRGWASSDAEIESNYTTVAAAALDRSDRPAAAVALTFRDSAVDRDNIEHLARGVCRSAAALGMRFKGRI